MFESELQTFERALETLVRELYEGPQKLSEACAYAMQGAGKRVRPLLVLLTHKIFSEEWERALVPALSVEMIHTFSLVHDDLPMMDDDDYRRGRLTVHRKFDESTALLVGDALFSDACSLLSGAYKEQDYDASCSLKMIRELSLAVGSRAMTLGQSLDLYWTGRQGYTKADLDLIHQLKTGKLFAASCALGAYSGGANAEQVDLCRSLGADFGLLYQIQDDLLDECEGTGKTRGKDQASEKLTYLRIMSRSQAEEEMEKLWISMQEKLQQLGPRSSCLRDAFESFLKRTF